MWIPNRQVSGSNVQFQAEHWPTDVYICAVFCGDAATCRAAWHNRVSVKGYTQPCRFAAVLPLQEWLQENQAEKAVL